ncbi:uncharacterized protein LOC124677102 [Lolium rigidum]|uniref:uncharacterized protein LOC124676951 n=1 Tax=Lolium rigidum TaxID=89674 RepID=UPI001F5CC2BF|nr:uncharacterized protein LOC124676951 [Lolium rigidum]XP_047069055.1 uncharacterized protein LOC124677102 [Lolium rigidum]
MDEKEEETRRLVGVGPTTPVFYKSDTRAREKEKEKLTEGKMERAKAKAERLRSSKAMRKAYYCTESTEEVARPLHERKPVVGYPIPFVLADETAPRRSCNWLRLLPFPRPDPEPIRSAKALKAQYDEFIRWKMPRSQVRAMNHKIVLQCLEWYNSKHPDDEYEPAPGVVTRCSEYNKSLIWTHGNFVARRKDSSCLPFLPAPRTLFFFELVDRDGDGVDEVNACTPIDEPVTEAYTFLGFPLGWGTRRHGGADCVCKTCYRQFHVPHIGLKRTCACGDGKVESVCKMCYLDSDVLHPIRGGFTFGQENFAKLRL